MPTSKLDLKKFSNSLTAVWPKATHIKLLTYLGGGSYGSVHLVEVCGNQYLMKSSVWDPTKPEPQTNLREEEFGLRLLHPGCDYLLAVFRPTPGLTLYFRPPENLGITLTAYMTDLVVKKARGEAKAEVEAEQISIALSVAEGLEYMHSLGISHSDIKPDNVIVLPPVRGEPRRAFLTDFGLSCDPSSTAREKKCRSQAGTARYHDPLLLTSGANYYLADVYSLAATFYGLWTGYQFLRKYKPSTKDFTVWAAAKVQWAKAENREIDPGCPDWVLDILTFKTRPTASSIVSRLRAESSD